MNHSLKIGLIAGSVAIIGAIATEGLFANTENDFFQFCTTRAYGWPAPWRIKYCECEGLKTSYPAISKIVNLSVVAGSGIAGFVFCGGISLMKNRAN